MSTAETQVGLAELIKRGGIYRDVQGNSLKNVLVSLTTAIPSIPDVPADKLLWAVLEREALMSTSIGHGIAIPHPRTPLITQPGGQFTALAFLKNPVDWNSLDGEKVDTLLLIISATAKQHLHTLSEINFFCRQEGFYRLLRERAKQEDILDFIKEAEKNWR